MNIVPQLFNDLVVDNNRLNEIDNKNEPRSRFIISMTPRSGSSYLCDVMKKSKRFGSPDEALNQNFIPGIMKKIPGRSPEEFLRNFIRCRRTQNGLSGLKASWFQFENFFNAMADRSYLDGFKYIYLTRRNVFAQAVSLYKATSSNIFHTNVQHSFDETTKLDALEYRFGEINKWYEHILKQERGWQQYFYDNRIAPLCISYEDIEADILFVMKRVAVFVGVIPENVILSNDGSIFKKIGNIQNLEWAQRFESERCSGE